MNNKIFFEKEGFESVLQKLNKEYEELVKIYDDIEKRSKKINGEGLWNGKGQKSFYDSYLSISKNMPVTKGKIEKCNSFLQKVNESYTKIDESLLKSIEDNKEKLSIN